MLAFFWKINRRVYILCRSDSAIGLVCSQIFIYLEYIKHGGGKIKRSILLSVLLLFSVALIFSTNYSSAATVNQTTTVKHNTTTTHKVTSVSASSTKLVGGLTVAQIKDGYTRTQKFYNNNYRLPNYVSYGSKKIPIATFQKILATQNLKIKLFTGTSRTVYITSDNINNPKTDNARVNSIVKGLKALGIRAQALGLGPNTHISALKANIPKNALVVDIYGGADAGLIYEMASSWYKSLKGSKKVFTVYWPTSKCITGLDYLVRAHDDNYDPSSFKGIAHPDQFLKSHGYDYIYSGVIANIVSAIATQSKT